MQAPRKASSSWTKEALEKEIHVLQSSVIPTLAKACNEEIRELEEQTAITCCTSCEEPVTRSLRRWFDGWMEGAQTLGAKLTEEQPEFAPMTMETDFDQDSLQSSWR
eukprot:gb/GEZN01018363.1/.p1 GENE.gb/GEZN01018363.1/~~gb/GEZN01018363.1/.p1  ORF type:complete len:107 (+),score=18.16 gb/GEZN01018363.1/:354-674(+)